MELGEWRGRESLRRAGGRQNVIKIDCRDFFYLKEKR